DAIDSTAGMWHIDDVHGTSTGAFEVRRTGAESLPLEVHYHVSPDSTAVPGVDYEPLSGTLTIPPGQRGAGIYVRPIDRPGASGNKTVTIIIDPFQGYTGDGAGATVSIAQVSGVHSQIIPE